MKRLLAVSPHLDDAVFSAGETLARLSSDGWEVTVATVFTASVRDPQGFALACQTDKGLPPALDYMALRREEDGVACERIGATPLHLPLPEAPHRGYASAPELFAELRPDDDAIVGEVARQLREPLRHADLVLSCEGIGDHIDHRRVLQALDGRAIVRWRDLPYGLDERPGPVRMGCAIDAKLDACAAYGSQLGFQFGDESRMRARLARQAERFDAPM